MTTTPFVENLPKPNALQSLWGSGDVERDRRRRNTAKSMISPGTREQTIYTPQSVLDCVTQVWPEGIQCDPCTGPASLVKAEITYDEEANGLSHPWPPRTYANPPFKTLKLWLEKARNEAGKELMVLCPVRTHRSWFRKTMESCDALVFLDPLCFEGFKQAFPAPLCVFYWGDRTITFYKAFKKLSRD